MRREFGKALTRAERHGMAEQQAAREADLLQEIAEAAERIAAAIGPGQEPVFRTDPIWRLLTTIERSQHSCSLSDVARLKSLSRQYVARLALEAEGAGLIDLARNDHDRRIVQLLLTNRGRAEMSRVRHHRRIWTAQLLLGLDTPRLRLATEVVRVIRQRLEQVERKHKPAAPGTKTAW